MTPSRFQVPPRVDTSGSVATVRETPVPTSTAAQAAVQDRGDLPAIRRPEEAAGPVRARQEPRLEAGEGADEDAVLLRVRLVEGQEAAVGRQAHRRSKRVPASKEKRTVPWPGAPPGLPPRGMKATTPRPRPAATGPPAGASARAEESSSPKRCASATRSGSRPTRASPMSRRRSLGSRSRQRSSRRRTAPGVSDGRPAHCGSRVRTAASTSLTVSPSKSFRPVSISKSTTPKAQMSARRSTAFPRACSGDM